MASVEVSKLHTFKGHTDAVYTLQPSSHPAIFFSAGGDGKLVQWDLRKPDEGQLIAQLPNSVYALHFHPEKEILIAGHNYEGIHIVDIKAKKEMGSLKMTDHSIFDIHAVDGMIYVAGGDGAVSMISLQDLVVKKRVQNTDKNARSIAFNPLTGDLAVGYSDNFIRVFDADDLSLKREWRAHDNSVFHVKYDHAGQMLFSVSRDAHLKEWDVFGGYNQAVDVIAHMYAINHLEFSPDGKHFVTCSMDKSIKVWDSARVKLLKVIDKARHAGHGTSVNRLLWTSHDDELISASDDRTISAWNINFLN